MNENQAMPQKKRGMKYFAYLCTVNGVLGALWSFTFAFACLGFVGMYSDYAVLFVLFSIAFIASIVFYIARIVCYARYKNIGVYPRWLFWGMSFTLWYGWDWFLIYFLVYNWRILGGGGISCITVLAFLPLINQIYLVHRRHLFVFDRSRLVYLPQKEDHANAPMQNLPPQPAYMPLQGQVPQFYAPQPPAPVWQWPPEQMAPQQACLPQIQLEKENNTMIKIGQKVKHSKYGMGTVKEILNDCILVDFGARQRMFNIPNAFLCGILHAVPESEPTQSFVKPTPATSPVTAQKPNDAQYQTVGEALEAAARAIMPVWVEQSFSGNMEKEQRLIQRCHYGTRGQDVYLKGCDVFGWSKSLAGQFGMMQIMYAYKGDPKGRSIWMLPHHKWVMPIAKKAECMWWNTITNDKVFEEWKEPTAVFYTDFTERITFAKINKYGYVFIGVFKPVEILEGIGPDGLMHYVKVYRLVQKDYNG